MAKGTYFRSILPLVLGALSVGPCSAGPVTGSLAASLTSGSLIGTNLPVTYSYASGTISPTGDTYLSLTSINFTLLGVSYGLGDITQGGQVEFVNGVLTNLTASFQGPTPANAQVKNITFGFGGPGSIGYIDLSNNFGSGSFSFQIPEPSTFVLLLFALGGLLLFTFVRSGARHRRSETIWINCDVRELKG